MEAIPRLLVPEKERPIHLLGKGLELEYDFASGYDVLEYMTRAILIHFFIYRGGVYGQYPRAAQGFPPAQPGQGYPQQPQPPPMRPQ